MRHVNFSSQLTTAKGTRSGILVGGFTWCHLPDLLLYSRSVKHLPGSWTDHFEKRRKRLLPARCQVFSSLVSSSLSRNTSASPFPLGRICSLTTFWQVSELHCTGDEPFYWAVPTGLGTHKNFPSGFCGQQRRAIEQKLFLQNKVWFICQSRHSTPRNGLKNSQETYAHTVLPILGISLKYLFLLSFVLADPITACVVQTLTLSKARSACSSFSPPFLHSGSFNLKVHDFRKQLCNQGWSGGVAFSQILIELKCLLGCSLSRQLVAFYVWFSWQPRLIYFHCK